MQLPVTDQETPRRRSDNLEDARSLGRGGQNYRPEQNREEGREGFIRIVYKSGLFRKRCQAAAPVFLAQSAPPTANARGDVAEIDIEDTRQHAPQAKRISATCS